MLAIFKKPFRFLATTTALVGGIACALGPTASAQNQPASGTPNILVIMGDDIGYWNIRATRRLVGTFISIFGFGGIHARLLFGRLA